jgi:hypothetical protein
MRAPKKRRAADHSRVQALTLSFADSGYRVALAGLGAIVVAAIAALAWPANRAFQQVSLADPGVSLARQATDSSRADDLDWLEQALSKHAALVGTYPSTLGTITPVCSQLTDPACALWHVDGAMYASDGSTPYYYQSEGTAYTLYARTDSLRKSNCPEVLPSGFTTGFVICRSGRISDR